MVLTSIQQVLDGISHGGLSLTLQLLQSRGTLLRNWQCECSLCALYTVHYSLCALYTVHCNVHITPEEENVKNV